MNAHVILLIILASRKLAGEGEDWVVFLTGPLMKAPSAKPK